MLEEFKGKKITVIGLGLLGGAVNDVKFLAENGAELIVTDLKIEKELEKSLEQLKQYTGIKYILGEHRLEDFRDRDYILQPGNVPLDSPYLAEARKNDIPVVESEALLMECIDSSVTVVGVTGTRGKSTVTHLIYEILRASGAGVHLGGNVKGVSALSLLKEAKPGDFVILELDSWALNGLGVVKKSPHIAVFTNFMDDHMNFYGSTALTTSQAVDAYFADKANIYKYQKKDDVLVTNSETLKKIRVHDIPVSGRVVEINEETVPPDWEIKMRGEHNRRNAAYAIAVARELGIDGSIIKKVITEFAGLPGRLELVRELNGVQWVNDTNGTTPDAVIAALKAYEGKKGKIVLIGGGADKKLDYSDYVMTVPKYVRALILFKGSASEKMVDEFKIINYKFKILSDIVSMQEAVGMAHGMAQSGDIVLLSPGAASFGMFKNEYDRGDQFNKEVGKLK